MAEDADEEPTGLGGSKGADEGGGDEDGCRAPSNVLISIPTRTHLPNAVSEGP